MKRIFSLAAMAAMLAFIGQAQTTTAPAFPFTYYIHDTTGTVSDYPLPSIYQFTSTALGSSSHIVVKVINTSGAPAFMGDVLVTPSASTLTQSPDFTVTGLADSIAVPSGGSLLFQVNFTPTSAAGPLVAYLQTSYQVQAPGCSFTSTNVATQCPSGLNVSATLNGTATQPQLVLSYTNSSGTVVQMQPSSTPLNFGNISTSSSTSITFTLANESNIAITVPAISVPAPTVYSSNPFALNASQVPATLAAGTSANFTVTFAPGQTGLTTTAIDVGSNTYPIEGAGVVIVSIDALQISYVDSTGVRTLPQTATPISFGQIVSGTSNTASLVFTVTNPASSYNAVTVNTLTATGTGFTLSAVTGASAFPMALAPGASVGFTLTFNPGTAGTYSGSLAVGTRTFTLTGLSVASPLPSLSLSVNPSPLSSQQQANVAVQLASASPLSVAGSITLAFTPSVQNVTSDPAIVFVGNNSLELPLTIASGAQNAQYNSQSAIAFQTGTTAGTLSFTVNFPNTAAYTQTFSIPAAIPQITSVTAVASNPNLIITVAGYDNTYSAGSLNFTFYDTSGKAYPPIAYNAAGAFQNLFFGSSNTSGGAFQLQATFPVTGDITQVGSVAVSISNSVGQANTTVSVTQ